MLNTTDEYNRLADSSVRPLGWSVQVAFDKAYDPSVTLFTLDVSVLNGPDILAYEKDDIVVEWSKYLYTSYSERIVAIEIVQETQEPSLLINTMADVRFNNYDDLFTPNAGGPLDEYLLPKRAWKILLGFGSQLLPQFFGLNESMPEIDRSAKEATFHLQDFLSYVLQTSIDETTMLIGQTTDEVLDVLLSAAGLTAGQYVLDPGTNVVPFFYAERGKMLGEVINDLIQTELGSLYMDEKGIIRFVTGATFDPTPVLLIDDGNTSAYTTVPGDWLRNSIIVRVPVREIQSLKSVYQTLVPYELAPGQTVEVFADFNDPVTSINTPTYQAAPIANSYFISTLDDDGTIPYTDIDLISADEYSSFARYTFQNTGASTAYIVDLQVYGTPAELVETLKIIRKDQDSIDKFGELVYEIENEYIESRARAEQLAEFLLSVYAIFNGQIEVTYRGNHALQINDVVLVNLDENIGLYIVQKIVQIYADARYEQRLTLRKIGDAS